MPSSTIERRSSGSMTARSFSVICSWLIGVMREQRPGFPDVPSLSQSERRPRRRAAAGPPPVAGAGGSFGSVGVVGDGGGGGSGGSAG